MSIFYVIILWIFHSSPTNAQLIKRITNHKSIFCLALFMAKSSILSLTKRTQKNQKHPNAIQLWRCKVASTKSDINLKKGSLSYNTNRLSVGPWSIYYEEITNMNETWMIQKRMRMSFCWKWRHWDCKACYLSNMYEVLAS